MVVTTMAPEEDVPKEMQQTLENLVLEMTYEKACRREEAIYDGEIARQLRVQLLLLEDENEDLHAQLKHNVELMVELEQSEQELQEDLETWAGNLESAQGDLRIRNREIETLKTELSSLHGVTMDSTKLLTEKLTLARELSSLKPEVDHLRSQAASHQSLLAEKLHLQRQLSTLQVELETERRATQKALAKEGKAQAEDVRLELRLETVQTDLAKERRDRQKNERETQKASAEWENKNSALESRLDALRSKLKATKEQLKETQTDLQNSRASRNRTSAPKDVPALIGRNPRKRAAVHMEDSMIGTPGDLPAAKKSRKGSALPGEKSTFSITPFLNRTISVAPESPPPDRAGSEFEDGDQPSSAIPETHTKLSRANAIRESTDDTGVSKPIVQAKKPGILGTAKLGKANSAAPPTRKPTTAPRLEQVTEEDDDGNIDSTTACIEAQTSGSLADETIVDVIEMKKKKRKLLGGRPAKTIFDDDEAGVAKGDVRLLGGVKAFGPIGLGQGGLGGPKPCARKGLAPSRGFGAISPLKKDRKGSAV